MERSGREMPEAAGQARHHQEVSQKESISRGPYYGFRFLFKYITVTALYRKRLTSMKIRGCLYKTTLQRETTDSEC